jgi:tripartite-type tricarboxylate transporter receptor subunit TctC
MTLFRKTAATGGRVALPLFAAGLLAVLAPRASAESPYPNHPVHVIVPVPAGAATDIMARLMAQELGKATGQSFIVDNRVGADGVIGADRLAKSAPDGYTIGILPGSTVTINPALYKLPFDPVKDLVPISNVMAGSFLLGVNPALPIHDLKGLVDYAHAHPGKLNYGAGSTIVQLAGELFKLGTRTDIAAIPYKGTGAQLTAFLGDEVQLVFDPFLALQYVKNGKMRVLAVTSPKRSELLPDVPTMQEAGLKDYKVEFWIGLFAPTGTPQATVDRLSKEVAKIMARPDIKARVAELSYVPVGSGPAEFRAQVAADTARWAATVKATNYKIDK